MCPKIQCYKPRFVEKHDLHFLFISSEERDIKSPVPRNKKFWISEVPVAYTGERRKPDLAPQAMWGEGRGQAKAEGKADAQILTFSPCPLKE